jgi:hypothetical protein
MKVLLTLLNERQRDKLFMATTLITYQIPAKARKLPLIFWHGIGQFSKTWETTPDGREGFNNIFLKRGFGVYLIDQPRREMQVEVQYQLPSTQHQTSKHGLVLLE